MLVTDFTRKVLARERFIRDVTAQGYIKVGENGTPLWKFQRGSWINKYISDVKITPDGQGLWIKVTD